MDVEHIMKRITMPWARSSGLGQRRGRSEVAASTAANAYAQKFLSLGVLCPAEVDRICAERLGAHFLIEDLVPAGGIAIAAGESAIGKSPFFCQLGLCVAAGVPFVGMPIERGRVLYFDMENSLQDCKAMRDSILGFLKLKEAPQDFFLKQEPPNDLGRLLQVLRPKLVIIDSLRSFRPDVTEGNGTASRWLQEIRKLSRKHGCAFVIVHHLRKPAQGSILPRDLESRNVVSWLLAMEGPRALVNQTDVRIAIEEGDFKPAALRVKWSRRVRGDSPVMSVERVFEDDKPFGYRHLTGAGLLSAEKRAVLDTLSQEFTTADTKVVRHAHGLGDGNDPTNKFLAECTHVRAIEKTGKGHWRKLPA